MVGFLSLPIFFAGVSQEHWAGPWSTQQTFSRRICRRPRVAHRTWIYCVRSERRMLVAAIDLCYLEDLHTLFFVASFNAALRCPCMKRWCNFFTFLQVSLICFTNLWWSHNPRRIAPNTLAWWKGRSKAFHTDKHMDTSTETQSRPSLRLPHNGRMRLARRMLLPKEAEERNRQIREILQITEKDERWS